MNSIFEMAIRFVFLIFKTVTPFFLGSWNLIFFYLTRLFGSAQNLNYENQEKIKFMEWLQVNSLKVCFLYSSMILEENVH